MDINIQELWASYIKKNKELSGKRLRLSSSYKIAKYWVNGIDGPYGQTKMLSNVEIHNAWDNPHGIQIARQLIQLNPNITLRELLNSMLQKTYAEDVQYPYIWWVCESKSPKKRAIHEDQKGLTFIKLGGKWQLVYSCQALGALVGSQGKFTYEDLPNNAYFVLWDNEDIARKHSG